MTQHDDEYKTLVTQQSTRKFVSSSFILLLFLLPAAAVDVQRKEREEPTMIKQYTHTMIQRTDRCRL